MRVCEWHSNVWTHTHTHQVTYHTHTHTYQPFIATWNLIYACCLVGEGGNASGLLLLLLTEFFWREQLYWTDSAHYCPHPITELPNLSGCRNKTLRQCSPRKSQLNLPLAVSPLHCDELSSLKKNPSCSQDLTALLIVERGWRRVGGGGISLSLPLRYAFYDVRSAPFMLYIPHLMWATNW